MAQCSLALKALSPMSLWHCTLTLPQLEPQLEHDATGAIPDVKSDWCQVWFLLELQ